MTHTTWSTPNGIYNYQTVTIASGQTDSDAIDLQGHTVVGIRMPSAFTGATITLLEAKATGDTFSPINPSGAGATYPVTVSQTIGIPAPNAACANQLKIRSSSSEGANRSIVVISRVID